MVVDLRDLELKTIHDPEAFRFEVLGNLENRRWVYSPRGEQAIRKAREALEVEEALDLEAVRAKEQAWQRQLQQASLEPAVVLSDAAELRPATSLIPLVASPSLPRDPTAMQARLNERAQAIADSYRQVLTEAGGLARECARCLMASPPSEGPCPHCGEAGQFAPLEVTGCEERRPARARMAGDLSRLNSYRREHALYPSPLDHDSGLLGAGR